VPGIVDGLAAAEGATMRADDAAVLAELDPLGVGADLDRTADRRGRHRVLVGVERTRQVFEGDACTAWKPSKGPRYGTRLGRSASNISQTVLSRSSG
jgi:hypothetical protein